MAGVSPAILNKVRRTEPETGSDEDWDPQIISSNN